MLDNRLKGEVEIGLTPAAATITRSAMAADKITYLEEVITNLIEKDHLDASSHPKAGKTIEVITEKEE